MRKFSLLVFILFAFIFQLSYAQKGIPKTSKAILLPRVSPTIVTTRVITPEEEAFLNSKPEKDRDDIKGRDTVRFRKKAPCSNTIKVISPHWCKRLACTLFKHN